MPCADRTVRVARSPHGGRKRVEVIRKPAGTDQDDGGRGSLRALPRPCLVWFGDAWHPVLVTRGRDALDAGRHGGDAGRPNSVEPDDPDSWLVLSVI